MTRTTKAIYIFKLLSTFILTFEVIAYLSNNLASEDEGIFEEGENLHRNTQSVEFTEVYEVNWDLDFGDENVENLVFDSPFLRAGFEQSIKDFINSDLECDEDSEDESTSFYVVNFQDTSDESETSKRMRNRQSGKGKCKGNKTRCKKTVKKSISDAGKTEIANHTFFKIASSSRDFCSTFRTLSIFDFFKNILVTASSFNYNVDVEVINQLSDQLEFNYRVDFVPASSDGLNNVQNVDLEASDPITIEPVVPSNIYEKQRISLENIFSHFEVDYDEEKHQCLQMGINCDDDEFVTHIWMMNKIIVEKTIPSSFREIKTLKGIFLGNNNIIGKIPEWMMEMNALEMLWLDNNRLTGTLPTYFGKFRKLLQLNLYGNQLSGPIPHLSNTRKLEFLHLGDNNFTGTIPERLFEKLNAAGPTDDDCAGVSFPLWFPNFIGGKWKNFLRMFNTGESSKSNLKILSLYNNSLNGTIPTNLQKFKNLVELNLGSNDLVGSLPTEIGWMEKLKVFDLHQNNFSGSIPIEIGKLRDLEILNFYDNRFNNSIPDHIEDLVNLKEMTLDKNNFNGSIPIGIGRLHKLEYLSFSENNMSGNIPSELGQLFELKNLDIRGYTTLSTTGKMATGGIPSALGNLKKWKFVIFQGNNFTGTIPSEVGNLESAEILWLRDQSISGSFPSELGNLKSLGLVSVANNVMRGTLPNGIGNMSNLAIFDIGQNEFTGDIPESVGELKSLSYLSLANLSISGSIPTAIGKLGSLQFLDVANNKLVGSIPSEIGDTQLRSLNLGNNNLDGTIPKEIGKATNLTKIVLGQNALKGPIPSEIGGMSELEEIDLGSNTLTGSIPIEIGNLAKIEEMKLGDNTLNGTIPTEMGKNAALQVIDLGGNKLSGEIPKEIATIKSLEVLDLESNEIAGNIPSEIGDLSNLTEMKLGSNALDGTIPSEIAQILSVEIIDLGGNNLNGNIPSEIATLQTLQVIDIGENEITGNIPSEFGNLESIKEINLSNNELAGTIPTQISQLETIQVIDVGSNQITGEIPPEIFLLENVQEISAGDNDLKGTIPSEIGSGINLQVIDFGGNQVSGSIPTEIGSLENLIFLDLGNNEMNGTLPSEIGSITNLGTLDVGSNNINGSLPDLSNLGNLEFLNISETFILLNRTENWDLCYLESTDADQLQELNCTNYCNSPVEECIFNEVPTDSCEVSGCGGGGHPICTELCKLDYSECLEGEEEKKLNISFTTDKNGWETKWEIKDGYDRDAFIHDMDGRKYVSNEVVKEFRCIERSGCSVFEIFNTAGDSLRHSVTFHVDGVERELRSRDSGKLLDFEEGECTAAPITRAESNKPSNRPTLIPSVYPSKSSVPSLRPTGSPSSGPSVAPSLIPSLFPTLEPSSIPSMHPSLRPSFFPTMLPSLKPSLYPSLHPTLIPSSFPSLRPTMIPSLKPSSAPSSSPSSSPSRIPSLAPSQFPSISMVPSLNPTAQPTVTPLTCVPFHLQIQLDEHPEEFSWSLSQDFGSVLIEVSYEEDDISRYYEYSFCLDPAGCHTFHVEDTWNDGICCEYGKGSYKGFLNNNAFALFEGGDFGAFFDEHFCVCLPGSFPIHLEFQTDAAASETSWDLQKTTGELVFSNHNLQSNVFYNHDVCLEYGCYNFIVSDTNADGICCGKGDGYFRVLRDDYSPFLLQGDEFGARYEETICGCRPDRYAFRFGIYPLENAHEATWILTSEDDGSVIERSTPLQENTLFLTDICLLYGCYKLTIFDTGEDGIGNYRGFVDNMVDPIFANGDWNGASMEYTFCDCPSNQFLLQLEVFTDENPTETSWDIFALDNSIIASNPTNMQPSTLYKSEYCLIYACYMFQIRDDSGDGICCGNGNGSYTGSIENSNTPTFQGGSFGAIQEEMFCYCPTGYFPFHLQVKTDLRPNESRWFLQTDERVELASKRYQQGLEVLHDHNFCLPHGCYIFRMEDLGGDGICCDEVNGNGYYKGYLEGDATVSFQGGTFTFVAEETFCR